MQTSLLKIPRALSGLLAVVLLVAVGVTGVHAGVDKNKDKDSDGYLGVYMQKLTKDVAKGLDIDAKRGVLISGVEDDSPAKKAGIEDGDVIVEFDGHKVDSPAVLRDLVEDAAVGESVAVKLIRDGDEKTIHVEIGERPEKFAWTSDRDGDFFLDLGDDLHGALAGIWAGPRLGVQTAELNKDLASYFDTDEDGGVLVLKVEDESVADEAGIKAGDVIQKIDKEDVRSADEIRQSLKDFEEGDDFDVVIVRHGKKQTLKATMNEQNHFQVMRGGDFRGRNWDLSRPKYKKFDDGRVFIYEDDTKKEVKELRKELEELKQELKKLKKD